MKREDIKAFADDDRLVKRGRVILYVFGIINLIIYAVLLLAAFSGSVMNSSNSSDETPYAAIIVFLIIAVTADILLLRCISSARFICSVCSGIMCLGVLYVLLGGDYPLWQLSAIALPAVLALAYFILSAVMISCTKSVREYIYYIDTKKDSKPDN